MGIVWIIVLILVAVFIYWYVKSMKKFRFDSIVMFNGGVGVGKTSTCLALAIKSHKKAHRIWARKHLFDKSLEEPLLYCNIPIMNYKYYSPFTMEHLLRKRRFNYKSVIYLSETSLIANSMDYKNKDYPDLNDEITEFLKLIRHELKGSYRPLFSLSTIPNLFIETQSINDNHYAFDRCITQSIFITSSINIPFFRVCKCRELMLFNNTINEIDDDMKESTKQYRYFIPKKIFKMYDSYAYSVLTDDLPHNDMKLLIKNLKTKIRFHIPTLHPFRDIVKNNDYLKSVGKFIEYKKEV